MPRQHKEIDLANFQEIALTHGIPEAARWHDISYDAAYAIARENGIPIRGYGPRERQRKFARDLDQKKALQLTREHGVVKASAILGVSTNTLTLYKALELSGGYARSPLPPPPLHQKVLNHAV